MVAINERMITEKKLKTLRQKEKLLGLNFYSLTRRVLVCRKRGVNIVKKSNSRKICVIAHHLLHLCITSCFQRCELQIRVVLHVLKSLFYPVTLYCGYSNNRLSETILLSIHNIGFALKIRQKLWEKDLNTPSIS